MAGKPLGRARQKPPSEANILPPVWYVSLTLPKKETIRYMRPEVLLALLTRATQGLVLIGAAICVVWRLNPVEQGVFFVYMSLGALLQLSDFGLAYASLQTASHMANPGGDGPFRRFRQKAHWLNFRVLSVAAILVGLLGAGILSSRLDAEHPGTHWMASWAAFLFAVFLTQLVNLELTLIEGGKSPPLAWSIRFFQELLSGVVFIVALIAGAGLWSLAAYWMVRFAFTAIWLSTTRSGFGKVSTLADTTFSWQREVWPFQWKIGLSILCGFLIFQAFNPIVLLEQGPTVAGKFGMSLALMNMLLMVTTVWPLSQAARYGRLIRHREFDELRHAFWTMCIASTLVATLGALTVFLVLTWMTERAISYVDRFADTFTTGLLLTTAVVHHITHCFSVVLRAERRDPTLPFTVVGSVVLVALVWICARYGGTRDIALANLAMALPGVPLVIFIYWRRNGRWWTASEGRSP